VVSDSGRGCLSTVHDGRWLMQNGYLTTSGTSIGDIVATKVDGRRLVYALRDEPADLAIRTMLKEGVSQVPVLRTGPPGSNDEVVGSLRVESLIDRVTQAASLEGRQVGDVMSPPLPVLGIGEPTDVALGRMAGAPGAVVMDEGCVADIVTHADLLRYFRQRPW
jgi:cystathionine beta-synthase